MLFQETTDTEATEVTPQNEVAGPESSLLYANSRKADQLALCPSPVPCHYRAGNQVTVIWKKGQKENLA